jgi:prepilin-type N-terminal cleavage/methylation domain-containing protein/prepilin-type processing-associated H-X9-DG protein
MTGSLRTRGAAGLNRRAVVARGFTLIEVLVVVAIIAMLISILLPSLKTAREQARIVACNANMHDFGNSHLVYATDFPPFFPPTPYAGSTINGNSPSSDDNLFILWYRRYAKSLALFSCPATTYKVRAPESVIKVPDVNGMRYDITTGGLKNRSDFERVAQTDTQGFGTSYEYNPWYDWIEDGKSMTTTIDWYYGKKPFKYDQMFKKTSMRRPTPAYCMLMHDADESGSVRGAPAGKATNNYPEPWDNHGARGLNMLFVDGHSTFILRKNVDKEGWRAFERR